MHCFSDSELVSESFSQILKQVQNPNSTRLNQKRLRIASQNITFDTLKMNPEE